MSNRLPFSMVLFVLILGGSPFAQAKDCDFDLVRFLREDLLVSPRQGMPGKVDFSSIVRRIESGELKMTRIPGQSVSKIKGLAPGQDVFVRSSFIKNMPLDKGFGDFGYDISTRIKRDVQFYRLSRHLGIEIVPETVLTKINGEEVSIQVRVYGKEFETEKQYDRYLKNRVIKGDIHYLEHKNDLENMAILDMVSGNLDRNISNMIFDEERNRMIAIDHADILPEKNDVSGIIWFWTDYGPGGQYPLLPQNREKILNLNPNHIAKLMRQDGLVNEAAIEQMKKRIILLQHWTKSDPEISIRELGQKMDQQMVR